jgi:ABC-type sugar transport system substrate-binding protein
MCRELPVTVSARTKLMAAALGAALVAAAAPARAADLEPAPGAYHVKHARYPWRTGWRDRCAYAGYYCLYAEYHYVYHYPFDDRPGAYRARRHRF